MSSPLAVDSDNDRLRSPRFSPQIPDSFFTIPFSRYDPRGWFERWVWSEGERRPIAVEFSLGSPRVSVAGRPTAGNGIVSICIGYSKDKIR